MGNFSFPLLSLALCDTHVGDSKLGSEGSRLHSWWGWGGFRAWSTDM